MTKQMPQQAQDDKCPYSPRLSLSTPLDGIQRKIMALLENPRLPSRFCFLKEMSDAAVPFNLEFMRWNCLFLKNVHRHDVSRSYEERYPSLRFSHGSGNDSFATKK